MNKLKLLVFLMPLILVACNQRAEAITPSPSALPSITPSLPHTPTPTAQPTATWLPPLPQAEAEAEVIKLLRDNGGCRLPCFWEIVPGETNLDKAIAFLYAFKNTGPNQIRIPRNDRIIQISLNMNSTEDTSAMIDRLQVYMTAFSIREVDDGTVDDSDYANPFLAEYIQYYSLPELLSNYGLPDRVWVSVNLGSQQTSGGEDLLFVYMDYGDSGWGVNFRMPLEVAENSYLGCPAQAFTSLYLRSPGDTRVAEEQIRWMEAFRFYSVEAAMSINVEEFYHQFKAPNYDECLETPKDVWTWE